MEKVTDPIHFKIAVNSTSFVLLFRHLRHGAIAVTLMDLFRCPKCPAFLPIRLLDIITRVAASVPPWIQDVHISSAMLNAPLQFGFSI